MSSYLEKQQLAFKSEVTSVAPKIATKRSLAPPAADNAPSPAPSNASNTSKADNKDLKRKREPEKENVVYSQPAQSGYGNSMFTQINYIIEHLKKKGEAKTFQELLEYLSMVNIDERTKATYAKTLRQHPRVEWIPDPELKNQTPTSGTFVHRPLINVRTTQDLIAYLQNKADAQGVPVKDLKDGWPDCEESIEQLELEHKILVTRTKKDNHARMVWSNDPTLFHEIDPDFQKMWREVELPNVDNLVNSLKARGQKFCGQDPVERTKAAPVKQDRKKKAPRKGGKTTNTHMAHLLKDFSHLKR